MTHIRGRMLASVAGLVALGLAARLAPINC